MNGQNRADVESYIEFQFKASIAIQPVRICNSGNSNR